MLKLPQILGWRPPVRGRHERPAAEAPSVRPEEAGEAAVLPEDLEETLEADLLQDLEETPEQIPEETPAEPEAPAAGGEPGQADFLAGRQFWAERQPEKALEALLRAGDQGYREAQYLCGRIYQQWVQAEGREKLALTWYRRAAKQGHLEAQLACGAMYEQEIGRASCRERVCSIV